MNLIGCVDGERNAVQAFPADDAREAPRMVRLPGGPEDALEDRLLAHRALLQRVQVVLLAERLPLQRVERLALQVDLTLMASEAGDVINVLHGGAAGRFAHDAAALHARPVRVRLGVRLMHRLHQQVGERVHLRLLIDDRQSLHGRAVAANAVAVRRVHRVVGARRHLRWRTGIDGLVNGLVRGGVLRRRPVDAVIVGVSLVLHLLLLEMMRGGHIPDAVLVVVGRWQDGRRVPVGASVPVGRASQLAVGGTDGAGRRREFLVVLRVDVDVQRRRRRDDVGVNQLAGLINLILTKILVKLHLLPVGVHVLVVLQDLLAVLQRFLLQLQLHRVIERRLAQLSLVLRVGVDVRLVRRGAADQRRVRRLANLANVLASGNERRAAIARCLMLKLFIVVEC